MDAALAKILRLFDDDSVSELLCNGSSSSWLVSSAGLRLGPSFFASDAEMLEWLQDFAWSEGVRLDPLCGSAGGLWQERFRWHCVLPPLSRDGPLFSLRRHRFELIRLEDFGGYGGYALALREAMEKRHNLLVVGPTGSGKTSFLVALLARYAAAERVCCVESTPEFPSLHPAWLRLSERRESVEGVGEVRLPRLIAEAMRLRPDRLVVGEIRAHEGRSFLEASFTGHGGVLATMHAGSADEAVQRLVYLAGTWRELVRQTLKSSHGRELFNVIVMARGKPPSIVSLGGPTL